MRLIRRFLSYLLLNLFFIPAFSCAQTPEILLAQVYHSGIDVREYLVSEKYDGVRAIWDGKSLTTRQGNVIHAPAWFTAKFPNTALDGELWIAHGEFDAVSGAIRKTVPVDAEWQKISYQIFELPNALGTFSARVAQINQLVKAANVSHLKAVAQFRVSDEKTLKNKLNQIVKKGGEGLMLHLASAEYVTGRSNVLLKLKPYFDAEAKVVGYVAGKGKYAGKMGALLLETPEGIRFKLGTGFSDAVRENPPKMGSLVTYTYKDITKTGKPKFASFLRERNAL
jgi:DNA ligase-1